MTEKRHGVVEQSWGYELIWANTDSYCAKILVFGTAGSKTSMHFHQDVDKSFFVNTGTLKVKWIDTQNSKLIERQFSEGETWFNPRLQPHQIEACTDGASLTEVSNSDSIDDCYRIIPGDNQKNND